MDTKHLGQKQLAARWSISEASLERWRSEGIGPKFLNASSTGRSISKPSKSLACQHRQRPWLGRLGSNENVAFHRHFCISADVLD